MKTIYKIHPAIGVCRIGDSDAFFIGPEKRDHLGLDIQADSAETEVTEFKVGGEIKRQGARFRVWEYQVDEGVETPVKELSGDILIEWSVKLANTKASGNEIRSMLDPEYPREIMAPSGPSRNASIADRSSLNIISDEVTISGANSALAPLDQGSFLGSQVKLGDVFTDGNANLIVLGGSGNSNGIPEVAGGPIPALDGPLPTDGWANNDRWHDDVSDGPVNARVHIPGQAPIDAVPAWVVCGPPNFGPGVRAPATLYDISLAVATKRNWRVVPTTPSFTVDILPILERSLSMKWVHNWSNWNNISDDWARLSKPGENQLRQDAFLAITQNGLRKSAITNDMMQILTKWTDGIFVDDFGVAVSVSEPKTLDRAALESCIATSFFPGIDAGYTISDPAIYSEPGRLSHQAIEPGYVTKQMALPWQADFNDCRADWWPSQRPNDVYVNDGAVPADDSVDWARGVGGRGTATNRLDMVNNFAKLGFVSETATGNQLEQERDPGLPV